MKILLTGFDPFGGEQVNPALEAVKQVKKTILGAEIIKLEIPTVFKKGAETVFSAIQEIKPDMILSIGQAGGRSAISVEFVAINYVDARIPDNEGNKPTGESIFPEGDRAYFSTLPVKAMVESIKAHQLPAFLSFSAGTFVCNELMYSVLYFTHKQFPKTKAGFIHVPYTFEQIIDKPDGTPAMGVREIAMAIEYALEAMVLHQEDLAISMGQTE